MPSQELTRRGPSGAPTALVSSSTDQSYGTPTFLGLPREVRHGIYKRLFDHDEAAAWMEPEPWQPYNRGSYPHLSRDGLGLQSVCRQVYREVTPVPYEMVTLGPDAGRAVHYLRCIGRARIAQIRQLNIFYQCGHHCECIADSWPSWDSYNFLNWLPVFDLLRKNLSARLRQVNIWVVECRENGTRCRLAWDRRADRFWRGLSAFAMAERISFCSGPQHEFFALCQAKKLGWLTEDWIRPVGRRPREPSTYGHPLDHPTWYSLANPRYPEPFNRSLARHGNMNKVRGREVTRTPGKLHFFDLPVEIRRNVYDLACDEWEYKAHWPTRPAWWNAGAGLLGTSRRVAQEARPSVYRTFPLYAGYPLALVDKLGADIRHVRKLDVHFSCFCGWGGAWSAHNACTIYARREKSKTLPVRPPRAPTTPDGYYDPDDPAWGPAQPNKVTGKVLRKYRDEWTKAMRRIRGQGALITDITVNFLSCCRDNHNREYQAWGSGQSTKQMTACRRLETHFLDLLEPVCGRAERVFLAGHVPPSLAVRLAQPRPGGPGRLSPELISPAMRAFVKGALEEEAIELQAQLAQDIHALPTQRADMSTYPRTPGWNLAGDTHFVLARDGRYPRALWRCNMQADEPDKRETAMVPVGDTFPSRKWQALQELLD